eukprot:9304839-Ditylum_brightwellii.AAC.1
MVLIGQIKYHQLEKILDHHCAADVRRLAFDSEISAVGCGGALNDLPSGLSLDYSRMFGPNCEIVVGDRLSEPSSNCTLNILQGGADGNKPSPGMSNMGPNCPSPGPLHCLLHYRTYLRCFAIPASIGLYYSKIPNKHVQNGILFALVSYTDYLDGYLARRWDVSEEEN